MTGLGSKVDPAGTSAAGDPVRAEVVDRILVLTIDREPVRNAIDARASDVIGHALADAEADPAILSVVVTGAGQRAFSAGADLKALARGETPVCRDHPEWGFAGLTRHAVSKPIIAAVNGLAFGGGFELVLASDLAVAAPHATFALPEVRRGILASEGGLTRLPLVLPAKIGMYMIMSGAPIDARQALRWGLLNDVVPAEELLEQAIALAATISRNSPTAVRASKQIARRALRYEPAADDTLWQMHDKLTQEVLASADAAEGIAAFAERRTPNWPSARAGC